MGVTFQKQGPILTTSPGSFSLEVADIEAPEQCERLVPAPRRQLLQKVLEEVRRATRNPPAGIFKLEGTAAVNLFEPGVSGVILGLMAAPSTRCAYCNYSIKSDSPAQFEIDAEIGRAVARVLDIAFQEQVEKEKES